MKGLGQGRYLLVYRNVHSSDKGLLRHAWMQHPFTERGMRGNYNSDDRRVAIVGAFVCLLL